MSIWTYGVAEGAIQWALERVDALGRKLQKPLDRFRKYRAEVANARYERAMRDRDEALKLLQQRARLDRDFLLRVYPEAFAPPNIERLRARGVSGDGFLHVEMWRRAKATANWPMVSRGTTVPVALAQSYGRKWN